LTTDPLDTLGRYAVIRVPNFQAWLHHICTKGYKHRIAMKRAQVADALDEALTKYMGWDVYHHKEGS
jgi:hypothetical protein